MKTAKVGLSVVLVALVFAGCLQSPDETPDRPSVPGNDSLDLDPIVDAHSDPFAPLFRVNLTSAEGEAMAEGHDVAPWIVGAGRVVHEHHGNGSPAIGVTTVGANETSTVLYEGAFSSAGDATFPSADPARGHVYFSHVPNRDPPQIIRRPLEPGGNETVVATLTHEDIPQGPWAVSPDGSLLAGPVWIGHADGAQTRILVRNTSDSEPGNPVYSMTGHNPRFASDSTIVFDRGHGREGIFALDIGTETVTPVVQSSRAEDVRQPVVVRDEIWFHVRVDAGEEGPAWDEIRRTTLDGEEVETLAWSEDYRLGRFDMGPSGEQLVFDVHTRR